MRGREEIGMILFFLKYFHNGMESNVKILNNNVLKECNNVIKEFAYGGIYNYIVLLEKE